ncbi:WD40 repeat-containing protein [Mycena chlorophos]|uniref:WD40 repeat-containing protein n=1 Tax=Mycena chlorophos TaxID=658473 RepID=A0A8H6TMF7_MYCCL|nr:WD40 repeat-containing protein [Mycena chlorophos]
MSTSAASSKAFFALALILIRMPSSNCRPSPHTSPLAKFNHTRPVLPADASPELTAFAEGRCEIVSDDIPPAIAIFVTKTNPSVVAVIGRGGARDCDPNLCIQRVAPFPNAKPGWSFGTDWPRVGLANVATELCVDDHESERRLVWVADDRRAKSYRWSISDKGDVQSHPVHTLRTKGFDNALFLSHDGSRIMRSGRSGMAVWDVDALKTHGQGGYEIVGKERLAEAHHTSRDVYENVELSGGAMPSRLVEHESFAKITVAKAHPAGGSQILAGYATGGVAGLDLQTQQVGTTFHQRGQKINTIATSASDPNAFVTASGDGVVRLYDARESTPKAIIKEGDGNLNCAIYEDIGGHPYIILGTHNSQLIRVWDVRNRAPIYKLATGNNSVAALAWDAPSQTLVAVTHCPHFDGYDYRWAKIGRHGEEWVGGDRDGDEDGEDYEEDEDEYDETSFGWPKNAHHKETAFDVAFDCGDHRIFRYQFKHDANPKVLPKYGEGRPRSGYY